MGLLLNLNHLQMIRNLIEKLELERNENRRFYTAENALDGINWLFKYIHKTILM